MILSSISSTLGNEGTILLTLVLWATLVFVFLFLKKRLDSLFLRYQISGKPSPLNTFEIRFLENRCYLYFFHIIVFLSILLGIINLYVQEPFILLLTILFILFSLIFFIVYLYIMVLFIWKTWWS
jgi:hypothetical protein